MTASVALGWCVVAGTVLRLFGFLLPGSSFPSLPSLRRACSAAAEGSVPLMRVVVGFLPLSCVSLGVLAAFSVHPACARAGGVGVKPGLCLTPGSRVWGEPSVCKKQVHYLLPDSYVLSSVGTQKSS